MFRTDTLLKKKIWSEIAGVHRWIQETACILIYIGERRGRRAGENEAYNKPMMVRGQSLGVCSLLCFLWERPSCAVCSRLAGPRVQGILLSPCLPPCSRGAGFMGTGHCLWLFLHRFWSSGLCDKGLYSWAILPALTFIIPVFQVVMLPGVFSHTAARLRTCLIIVFLWYKQCMFIMVTHRF